MKTKVNLDQYLKMGGDLNKIDLSKTFSEYSDKNQFESIISFEDKGEMNGSTRLIHLNFANGKTHRYALTWIYTQVEIVLDSRFI